MYLIDRDFVLYCDSQTLTQVINVDTALRRMCEYAGQDQIKSYLAQRYDLENVYGEFTDTPTYSNTVTYKGNNRVYLDGDAYNIATAYVLNDIVLDSGSIYLCIQAGTGQAVTDTNYWTLLGAQYDFFYITLPSDPFNFRKAYIAGDTIWYKDKQYTCILANTNQVPDSQYGANFWGSGVTYTVTAGTLPTDSTKWTNNDNRNNFLVQMLVEIITFNMFKKVAPRNIQQLRIDNYHMAIEWLEKAGSGLVSANLPLIIAEQGSSIRWGSTQKTDNLY